MLALLISYTSMTSSMMQKFQITTHTHTDTYTIRNLDQLTTAALRAPMVKRNLKAKLRCIGQTKSKIFSPPKPITWELSLITTYCVHFWCLLRKFLNKEQKIKTNKPISCTIFFSRRNCIIYRTKYGKTHQEGSKL